MASGGTRETHFDSRQAIEHGMVEVALPVFEPQDMDRPPHCHPTENQQSFPDALSQRTGVGVAKQAAQGDAEGEYHEAAAKCSRRYPL